MFKHKSYLFFIVAVLLFSVVFVKGCSHSKIMGGRTVPSIDINKVSKLENVWPIVILGSGPAGLAAALYGVWGNIKTLVIQGPKPGGLLMDTSKVENWPGNQSILGEEIITNLQKQVGWIGEHFSKNNFNEVEFLDDTIVNIDSSVWPVRLETENGQTIHALTVIIATGASPKWLDVPGEKDFLKNGVSTCANCDAGQFANKDVVVVGGGDAAIEEAIQCARWVKTVTMLVRKESFRASPSMQSHLKEYPTIKVQFNTEIKKVIGDENGVNAIEIYNNSTDKTSLMPINGIFVAIGHTPNSQIVKDILKVDKQGYIEVKGRSQVTSIDWFFAAGDVEDHVYRQAGVASGHGIQAALDANSFLTRIGFNNEVALQLQKTRKQMPKASKATIGAEIETVASQEALDAHLQNYKGLIVIDAYKNDCAPCKKMMPIFELASTKLKDKARFLKINVEDTPEIAQKLHILSIPCFFLYHNGKLVARYQGIMTESDFMLFIEKFLNEQSDQE